MSKERLEWFQSLPDGENHYWTTGNVKELLVEIDRCHAEIERLEKALEGSESLRHTIMTAALDAKRAFRKEIEGLNKALADSRTALQNVATAYKQVMEMQR